MGPAPAPDPEVEAGAEERLRLLGPQVLGILVRRGGNLAAAEDAVQEALVEAYRRWPADGLPRDPKAWLVTVAQRKLVDLQRSESARRRREERELDEPPPGPTEQADDTLLLYFLCCHPSLTPSSAVALTLRAVGGLTTRQVAEAYLVPEATMAQRISRAKRTVDGERLRTPGDLRSVLTVLYLVFNEGYSGEVDLAAEAIRLTRQLATISDEPEVAGLLALMLLHHARRPARFSGDGALVPLAEQDRTLWDTALIGEGVAVLQAALARDRLGEYQAQAAIAALHADARTAEETDWTQVLEWYDELAALTDSPVVALNRAVAVGEADGPLAGLRALAAVPRDVPRHDAVAAHLHERAGDLERARDLYAAAARAAGNAAERDHLTRQAARLGHPATS
ncbi:RNA polymerase sigma factor [Phycicoccus ginsengisoli]